MTSVVQIEVLNSDGTKSPPSNTNPLVVSGQASTAGTTTSVSSSATAVTLKAANTSRKSISIANDSTAILYVLLGTGTVSSTVYTFALDPKSAVAYDRTISGYTGAITGIWASANGFATITEFT